MESNTSIKIMTLLYLKIVQLISNYLVHEQYYKMVTVKWQIVNTGNEAKQASCLRGGFHTTTNNMTWKESFLYRCPLYAGVFAKTWFLCG